MDIIQKLNFDFQNMHSEVFDNSTATFRFKSDWKAMTDGVSQIIVYLSGEDPLTGRPIPKDAVSGMYSAGSTGVTVKAPYYGDFLLRFDAVLDDGRRIENAIPPKPVELRVMKHMPKIVYTVSDAKHGFMRLDFTGTNCWQRCNGRLWLRQGKSYQRIPKLEGKSKVCYISDEKSFEVLADPGIPTPKRTDGDQSDGGGIGAFLSWKKR